MLRVAKLALWGTVLIMLLLVGCISPSTEIVFAQQPTGSVPTVTGTAAEPIITVDASLQQVTVYAGPGSFDYPAVGVLLANETAPALGRQRAEMIGYRSIMLECRARWLGYMHFMLSYLRGRFFPL